ncbi:dihydrodipicolinate synthase family protein [Parablautia sp. Marseille-Q6255]|uniref:dihydrodipicolinate synthase family protein n=1 Tax=Parablautia sp. Marseille-Q6255 TaxID=3039593 RepID=UPI0024BC2F30|nr:dihydrodipicolinate synthase family protein [Parablautia sp. Marseille-Q6255]
MEKIKGMIPPIVTPFTEVGTINDLLIEKEMDISLQAGVDGLSVGGSTGEGPTLKDAELAHLISLAKKHLKPEQPVVCGIMRMCTEDAIRTGLVAKDAGADAIMVTPTAYNALVPNEEGMFDFYSQISEKVQIPIIIYNVIPQNEIKPTLFKRLLKETKYVRGVKQSVGGVSALYAMKMCCGDEGKIFAATDDMLATCYELGADGAISAALAVFPKECVEMWHCIQNGNRERAQELQRLLYYPWQALGGNQFPIRLKYALKIMGRDGGYCRSPIVHLPESEKRKIEEAFKIFI